MTDAPYQVKTVKEDGKKYFLLVDTRNESIIDFADPEIQEKDWLYSARDRLNTNWFFDNYV